MTETIDGGISFAHSNRKHTGYEDIPFEASYSPQYTATLPTGTQFDNHPLLRKFTSTTKLAASTPLTSTSDWFTNTDDRVDTIGLGVKMTEVVSRLDLGADYVYSHAIGKVNTVTGSAITPAGTPLPDTVSRLHSFQLYGKYKLNKDSTLKLSFMHQRLRTDDWAWDSVNPNTMANVLSTGQLSPNYSVNVIGVSVSYKYW